MQFHQGLNMLFLRRKINFPLLERKLKPSVFNYGENQSSAHLRILAQERT